MSGISGHFPIVGEVILPNSPPFLNVSSSGRYDLRTILKIQVIYVFAENAVNQKCQQPSPIIISSIVDVCVWR